MTAKATGQVNCAYTSRRGAIMSKKTQKTQCISVFKGKGDISKNLSVLWAEVINHYEQSKGLDDNQNLSYNEKVQSCPCLKVKEVGTV